MNIGINSFKTWAETQIGSGAADQAAMLPAQANEAPQQNRPLVQRNMLGLQGAGAALGNFIRANMPGNAAQNPRVGNAAAQGAQGPLVRNELRAGNEEYKQANNQVRSSILSMVRKELGLRRNASIDSFPSGVRKAMNYGFFAKLFNCFNDWSEKNARPLTARRIKAITDAVQAEQARMALENLMKTDPDCARIINGDRALKKALKGNSLGTKQMYLSFVRCPALKTAFITDDTFRAALTKNLQDGLRNPLPTGTITFSPTGIPGEFDAVKADVGELLSSAYDNTDVVNDDGTTKYDKMLGQCFEDYDRKDFKVCVNGKFEDVLDGVKSKNDKEQIEKNIDKLLGKLKLPVTKHLRMQMLEFITQGSMMHTTTGQGQSSRFSLPQGTIAVKPNGAEPLCEYNFTVSKNGLKCELTTKGQVRSIGNASTGTVYYNPKESSFKGSLFVDFGMGGSAANGDQRLTVTNAGVPQDKPDTTIRFSPAEM